jgi:hypothetical protein
MYANNFYEVVKGKPVNNDEGTKTWQGKVEARFLTLQVKNIIDYGTVYNNILELSTLAAASEINEKEYKTLATKYFLGELLRYRGLDPLKNSV